MYFRDDGAVYNDQIVGVALGDWRDIYRIDVANKWIYTEEVGYHYRTGGLMAHIWAENGDRKDDGS